MTLTIDNLDGNGAVDYSAAMDRSETFTIERTLNATSIVRGMLCLVGCSLATPVRQARVTLTSDAGTILFTGYLATEPVAIYAGVASEGPVYRLALSAVSDEWLLDKQAAGAEIGVALGSSAGTVLSTLAQRLEAGRLNTSGLAAGRSVGVFEPLSDAAPGANWSTHAGSVASTTYAAYRAVGGALNLVPAGNVVHTLSDGDGTLSVAALKTSAIRELANDVTVSGAMEPAAYWTELFEGDGTTTVFNLAGEPDAPSAGRALLIDDDFAGAALNLQTWQLADPGSHMSLSGGAHGAGLTLTGGNGIDGQTTLTAWGQLELGGTLVIELGAVALNPGSAGVLGGLYQGTTQQANCFAGFSVSQAGGQTILSPLVNGLVTGTALPMLSGHTYTLRLHLHCPELLRLKQSFYTMVNGAVEQFGDGLIGAPLALVFEVRDLATGSNTPVTVLYDSAVASSPAQANFVAVNSVELFGSIGAVAVTRTGSAWITSTDPATGTVSTRLAGKSYDGVDCSVTSSATGKVTFFIGRVPVPGETITVSYRGRRRAVARLADAASLAAEAAGGSVGTARWLGKVLRPGARSSEDCENAAQAILSFSTNRAAAVTGSYALVNPAAVGVADIWPGDVLALTANGTTITVLVRRVAIEEQGATPEALTYKIAFANDWAEGLGISLSEAIAVDALLPATALELAPGASAPVLANLQQLTVTAASTTSLTIDAGTNPPAGGGFEVRRHDGGFGQGAGATGSGDLFLRSPVRGFSIPRTTMEETFFVRMYDGSTPPLYSRESAAIVTQLPIG
jgi:hypothetical protein